MKKCGKSAVKILKGNDLVVQCSKDERKYPDSLYFAEKRYYNNRYKKAKER